MSLTKTCERCETEYEMVNNWTPCPCCRNTEEQPKDIPYSERNYEDIEITKDLSQQGIKPDFTGIELDFSEIIGHDKIKLLFTRAITAKKPVHILLASNAGIGKTIFLNAINKSLGRYFTFANNGSTRTGLANLIINNKPYFLGIDEIDKLKMEELQSLLLLMSSGRYIKNNAKMNIDLPLECSVFATCNNLFQLKKKIPELINRFVVVWLPDYSDKEFLNIGIPLIMRKYDIPEDVAGTLTRLVMKHRGKQIRELENVAKLIQLEPTKENIKHIMETLDTYKPNNL